MNVKLTREQALQLAANAVNAATPVGMGMLHYQDTEYTPEDLEAHVTDSGIQVDYFQGRMTKLYIFFDGDEYCFPESDPRPDYQSWCGKYPTYQALVDSVTGE